MLFRFELWVLNLKKKEKEKMNKTPYHSPYIYDARYHANPYNIILRTTVLSDIHLGSV